MKLVSNSFALKSGVCYLIRKLQIRFLCAAPARTRSSMNKPSSGSLYSRISPLGDPSLSVATVLDQWIVEGNYTCRWELQKIIRVLMVHKRFKHALEVSLWMTNKRGYAIAPYDAALRLKLICKNFGIEQVEKYFEKIPEKLKTFHVYLSLLNCYTVARSVDKAESTMRKARDLGYVSKPIWYNLMMQLYHKVGNREKVTDLLTEMDAEGISPDQFTFFVCMSSSAESSDAVGMGKILKIIESDPTLNTGWQAHFVAAEGYLKMGMFDEALDILNKMEKKSVKHEKEDLLFVFLIKLYAEAQKKDAVYRVWNRRRKTGKLTNKVYISMMRALGKFADIEGMEKILDEWDSSGMSLDFRVPNFLVDAYCSSGRLDRAVALIARVASRDCRDVVTWCKLAEGYVKENQMPKAVEALKKAMAECAPNVGARETLAACLECLGKCGNWEKAIELVKSVRMRGVCREGDISRLMRDVEFESCVK
ncbi:Pentatricopeptide repeat-containing protein -mitochondrial [Striga hermonthica]|uniref:Pentatricopeptide repeat-containing protein -mitochondrial n=1 Tax=Striga hermonthica TaxID=68872 RepID=A0A9N7NBF4_STRHE|nr:Pentatricopeptide repeat-containing protein -mitochondrial [Striga hermonthica]